MTEEDLKKLLIQAFNDGHLKGYEEGIGATIEMLQTFRKSLQMLKEERMSPK